MNRLKPAVCAIALIGLAACSNTQQEQPKLDYKSKKQTDARDLASVSDRGKRLPSVTPHQW